MQNPESRMIDKYTADYINKYRSEMDKITTLEEMFSLVTSVLVFKELVLSNFKKELEYDMTEQTHPNDSPEEICRIMEEQSRIIAKDIDLQVSKAMSN